MPKIAVIRSNFLPASETFIYSELVNVRKATMIVCAKKLMNTDRFPFQPVFLFRNQQELQEILSKSKAELIHARFGLTGAEILQVKKRLGLPMLTSFHGFDLPSNKRSRRRYKGSLQRLFREGELFTATSRDMAKILIRYGCPKRKVIVHHSGIDVDQFPYKKRNWPEDGKVIILSVGRLVEKKGMKYLIDAFAKVRKRFPNVELRIAGEGKLRKKLEKQIRNLRLQNSVQLLGEISHAKVAEQMQQAHLFVLASVTSRQGDQEGIPNVLKEAMATGLPVISTRHAGIPELVCHEKSGLLVAERESGQLAKKLIKLLKHPDKWGDMGKRGRRTVTKSFHASKQIHELEEIYKKLLRTGKERTNA